jgi:hypothetical protein
MSAGESPLSATRSAWRSALWAVPLLYLAVAVAVIDDYGPTWDCASGSYPYGERLLGYLETGDERFLDNLALEPVPVHADPHPDFDGDRLPWWCMWPLAPTLSALCCRILWTGLGWLPAMAAHNLAVPLFVFLLLIVMMQHGRRQLGAAATLAAGLFLVLQPRFFAHGMNNLKDVPLACLYTCAIRASRAAILSGRLRWWLAAGATTGLALASKANALFIPVQMGLYLVVAWVDRRRRGERLPAPWLGIPLAGLCVAAVYFAVSPPIWHDTLASVATQYDYVLNRGNALLAGDSVSTAENIDGALHALWTTPLALLLCAAVGLFRGRMAREERCFLLLAVAVPIGRTLLPGMRNFDGMRHFIEFLPPLALLAGAGLVTLSRAVARRAPAHPRAARVVASLPAVLLLGACVWPTIATHPNGICYYNEIVGGLSGAQSRGIKNATDYWANSYWQGLDWLDREASPGARLIVPLAATVVEAAAPVRLRADITLQLVREAGEPPPPPGVLYVMWITRETWYGGLIRALELDPGLAVVHEIRVQDGPILRIVRIDDVDRARAVDLAWRIETLAQERADQRVLTPRRALSKALRAYPDAVGAFLTDVAADRECVTVDAAAQKLKRHLPDVLHPVLDMLTRSHDAGTR